MNQKNSDVDWSLTTWKGSRREQLRRACKLSLRERLIALDEMQTLADHFTKKRNKRQLPAFDKESN